MATAPSRHGRSPQRRERSELRAEVDAFVAELCASVDAALALLASSDFAGEPGHGLNEVGLKAVLVHALLGHADKVTSVASERHVSSGDKGSPIGFTDLCFVYRHRADIVLELKYLRGGFWLGAREGWTATESAFDRRRRLHRHARQFREKFARAHTTVRVDRLPSSGGSSTSTASRGGQHQADDATLQLLEQQWSCPSSTARMTTVKAVVAAALEQAQRYQRLIGASPATGDDATGRGSPGRPCFAYAVVGLINVCRAWAV